MRRVEFGIKTIYRRLIHSERHSTHIVQSQLEDKKKKKNITIKEKLLGQILKRPEP